MLVISHPTGNTFVRALLEAANAAGMEFLFFTTIAWKKDAWLSRVLPEKYRAQLSRRSFPIPDSKIRCHPYRECLRLAGKALGCSAIYRHETGRASVDAVYRDLDNHVSAQIRTLKPTAVHAYEDGALSTFRAAREIGAKCVYELPIAYWEISKRLLAEEAERCPEWEMTLLGNKDSEAKCHRKTEELELADVVVVPSKFVQQTLPDSQKHKSKVAEFGSPSPMPPVDSKKGNGRLRLLFAGQMTQRKGLADLFAAMKLLKRRDVELVVLGEPMAPMEFYRRQYPNFIYEAPRPHVDALRLMGTCDALVLPSIVEGRALVQQEALALGLPLIVTPNAGGEDLIEPGKTGWLVPIRSPEKIAEAIARLADNMSNLPMMREYCRRKAAQYNWSTYAGQILSLYMPGQPSVNEAEH